MFGKCRPVFGGKKAALGFLPPNARVAVTVDDGVSSLLVVVVVGGGRRG